MSPLVIGLLVMVATVAVLATGMPVAFGLGLVAVSFLMVFEGLSSLDVLADTFYGGLAEFTLVSIPMFVVMGVAVAVSPAGKSQVSAGAAQSTPPAMPTKRQTNHRAIGAYAAGRGRMPKMEIVPLPLTSSSPRASP